MHCLLNRNQSQNWIERFLDFRNPQNSSVSPFGSFHRPKWQISLPFYILQQVKSLLFHIPEAWKRYTFRVEPPRKGYHREYPPPPGYDPSIGGSSCWMAGLELKLFILHSVNRLTQLASLKVLGSIDRYGQFLYVHVRHWQLVSIVIIYANQICQYDQHDSTYR